MTKITVFHLAVKIEITEQQHKDSIDRFIKMYYTSKGLAPNANIPGVDKEFVSRVGKNVYVMHINQFMHLMHYLQSIGQDLGAIERTDATAYEIVRHEYEVRSKWVLRDEQQPIYDFIIDNPVKSKMVSLQTGGGKSGSLTSKIKIPGGWTTMGAIKPGDVVTAADGTPTTVTGIYPQGSIPIYRVTTIDGRSTECCLEHLWKIHRSDTGGHGWRVVNTQEVIRLMGTTDPVVHIPLIKPEDGPDIDLPEPAHTLMRFPEIFHSASKTQRLAILQGILNRFATVQNDGSVTYTTESREVIGEVQNLVWSLGGIAIESIKPDEYELEIRHPEMASLLTCEYKQGQIRSALNPHDNLKLQIVKIELIGKAPAQCISIDHPDRLYVTDDFIVTHNTLIALAALASIGMRIGICIVPKYIEKWVMDVVKVHDSKTAEIMVVSGSKGIRGLAVMARDKELTAKYYIFASRTMQDFISAYEVSPEDCQLRYGVTPFELFQLTGIGSLLVDETHEQFHAIFKIILYSNVQFQLGLSATLISDDPVVSRAHKIVYTDKQTYALTELNKYADVYALPYYIPESMMKKVRTTNFGSNHYSHAAFENSMVKNRPHLQFYVQLITANMEALFLDRYEKNDKCLIFVGTINFATILAELYKKLLPHLRVTRYCEDDPEENLYESDLIISTVQSSGTAVDIEDLRVCLQTVNVSSTPQNIQNLGRLRELDKDKPKEERRDVRFGYLFAENIRKQVQYHHRREELFAARVASHRTYKAKMQTTLKLPT